VKPLILALLALTPSSASAYSDCIFETSFPQDSFPSTKDEKTAYGWSKRIVDLRILNGNFRRVIVFTVNANQDDKAKDTGHQLFECELKPEQFLSALENKAVACDGKYFRLQPANNFSANNCLMPMVCAHTNFTAKGCRW
jgi:hypothetical protein